MRRRSCGLLLWLAALAGCALGLAAPLRAEAEQSDEAEARQRFMRGVELYEAAEYSAALAEFTRAHELRPHFALLLNIAQCYANIGRYTEAIANLERYLSEGGGRVPRPRRAEVEAELGRLRSLFATVAVVVNVAGAAILVDDVEVGVSPLAEPLRVRSGLRVVEARREGYRSARVELMAAGGTEPPPVELTLVQAQRTTSLTVESPLRGAQVTIDGQLRGEVPWTGAVEPGEHLVELSAERHLAIQRRVRVEAGVNQTLSLTLERLSEPAQLRLEVDVDGASVSVNGDPLVEAPSEPLWLEAGQARVRVEREGFSSWEGEVPLREGQLTTARIALSEGSGRGASPAWFWTMIGLTASAGLAATLTGVFALQREADFELFLAGVAEGVEQGSYAELEARRVELGDEARRLALSTDVLLGVAGATAIAGLILAFFTRFRGRSAGAVFEFSAGVSAAGYPVACAVGRF